MGLLGVCGVDFLTGGQYSRCGVVAGFLPGRCDTNIKGCLTRDVSIFADISFFYTCFCAWCAVSIFITNRCFCFYGILVSLWLFP